MPEIQDFDSAFLFMDPIVNSNRCVQHHPDAGATLHRRTNPREFTKQLHMIEQRDTKPVSGARIVYLDIVEDYSKIF